MQLQGEYTMVSSRLPSFITVSGEDGSESMMVMMRGGVAEVDPFLVSQNTLGNGNRKLKISNDKCQMVVAGMRWWFALGNEEVE